MLPLKSSAKCGYACGRDATRELVNGERVCEQCYKILRDKIDELSKRIKK